MYKFTQQTVMKAVIREVERKEAHRKTVKMNSVISYEGVIPDAPDGCSRKKKSRLKR